MYLPINDAIHFHDFCSSENEANAETVTEQAGRKRAQDVELRQNTDCLLRQIAL